MIAKTSPPPGPAGERGERVLAVVAALARAGGLVILGASLVSEPWGGPRAAPLAILASFLTVESVTLIVTCAVTGRLTWVRAAVDATCLTVGLGASAVPAVLPGAPAVSPFYNFTVVAVVCLGLADWPLAAAVGAASGLALANLIGAVWPGSNYPLWNAVPNSATYLGVAVICWVLAWLLRASARALDRHREVARTRAAALARERERARQQADLRAYLLSTVDELATSAAFVDERVRQQVRLEARWLTDVVRFGLPEPAVALLPALRDLVAEKAIAGMRIHLVVPDVEPRLGHEAGGAVVEAAREALTNVAKHAGRAGVVVTARPAEGGLAVEIVDTGRGYDPADTPGRLGQQRSIRERIRGVGGRVEIESAPGSGTRVHLWVPTAGAEAASDAPDHES